MKWCACGGGGGEGGSIIMPDSSTKLCFRQVKSVLTCLVSCQKKSINQSINKFRIPKVLCDRVISMSNAGISHEEFKNAVAAGCSGCVFAILIRTLYQQKWCIDHLPHNGCQDLRRFRQIANSTNWTCRAIWCNALDVSKTKKIFNKVQYNNYVFVILH